MEDEHKARWLNTTIAKDVGISQNSVRDLLAELRLQVSDMTAAQRAMHTDDVIAEKILRLISAHSATLAPKCLDELEGVPGGRQFEIFHGRTNTFTRDLPGIVNHYHMVWGSMVRNGHLGFALAAPTRQKKPPGQDVGRSAGERAFALHQPTQLSPPPGIPCAPVRGFSPCRPCTSVRACCAGSGGSRNPRSLSPSQSLSYAADCGVEVGYGATTTTDWSQMCVGDDESQDFECVTCFDAQGIQMIEGLCFNCFGLGHRMAVCPSPKKRRTFDYCIAALTMGRDKADERARQQGRAPGGKAPPPRGQQKPFRSMPRQFRQRTPRQIPPQRQRQTQLPRERGYELDDMLDSPAPEECEECLVEDPTIVEREYLGLAAHGKEVPCRTEPQAPETLDMPTKFNDAAYRARIVDTDDFFHQPPTVEQARVAVEASPEESDAPSPAPSAATKSQEKIDPPSPDPSEESYSGPSEIDSDTGLPRLEKISRAGMIEAPLELFGGGRPYIPGHRVYLPKNYFDEFGLSPEYAAAVARENARRVGTSLPPLWIPEFEGDQFESDEPAVAYASEDSRPGLSPEYLAALERSGDEAREVMRRLDAEAAARDDAVDDPPPMAPQPYMAALERVGERARLAAALLYRVPHWLMVLLVAMVAAAWQRWADAMQWLTASGCIVFIIFVAIAPAAHGLQPVHHGTHVARLQPRSAPPPRVEKLFEVGSVLEGTLAMKAGRHEIRLNVDSGASSNVCPASEAHLLDEITCESPNVVVEGIEGRSLRVAKIGNITSRSFASVRPVPGGKFVHTISKPKITRWLAVEGMKPGTWLLSVNRSKHRDGIWSYFNPDNAAGLDNCLRWPDGCYTQFEPSEFKCEVIMAAGTRMRRKDERGALEVHASLGHANGARIARSGLFMRGFDLESLASRSDLECNGCRRAVRAPDMKAATTGSRAAYGSKPPPVKSTEGFDFFGQRMDTDLCLGLPASWPHKFTSMMNFCDRHTAERYVYCLRGHTSAECASCLVDCVDRFRHRLKDGRIWVWHTDNDKSFEGPECAEACAQCVIQHAHSVPDVSNTNAVAESNWRVVLSMIVRMRGFADAPACLWPWAARASEQLLYYLSTDAHSPPVSPYRFGNAQGPAADLSWANPLFCDVVVHVAERDRGDKTSYSGYDACHLGYDHNRLAHICYVPELRRISTFIVSEWRRGSFEVCKSIHPDTPVTYEEIGVFRSSPETQRLVPRRHHARFPRASPPAIDKYFVDMATGEEGARMPAEKEGARVSAETEGAERLTQEVCASLRRDGDDRLVYGCATAESSPHDPPGAVEVNLLGSTRGRKSVALEGLPGIKTLDAARASKWWPMIQKAMEDEIAGKLYNKAWTVVRRPQDKRVLSSKWVINVKLADDGSIAKIKARFVGCGYSQVPGKDYDEVYASTLPSACFRLWASIVADEDLETDHIDAVKAFTQAPVDRELYVEMPLGFDREGCVLRLHKALEGIKQGAFLWFKLNKFAWNKVGCHSSMAEPNLYTHAELPIVAAVFADDVAVAFNGTHRAEYLAMRAEYAKVINIDALGPERTVPVSLFTGVEVTRDRAKGTLHLSMGKYLSKLGDKYRAEIQRVTGGRRVEGPINLATKVREDFEKMDEAPGGEPIDRAEYLTIMGELTWPVTMCYFEAAFYTSFLGQFMMSPTKKHRDFALQVVAYLVQEKAHGITFGGDLKTPLGLDAPPPHFEASRGLYAVTDSSWNRRPQPHGGHLVLRMNAPIMWSAKRLKVVADSTAEAETAQGSRATKDVIYARMVLDGIKRPVLGPTAVLGDNAAMHKLVVKEGSSQRTRYFERATVLIKYAVLRGIVQVYLVGTHFMVADILTKATDAQTFAKMRDFARNNGWRTIDVKAKTARLADALLRSVRSWQTG